MNEWWNEWLLTVCRSTHDGSPAAGMRVLLSGRDHRAPPGQLSLLSRYFRFLLPCLIKRGGGGFPCSSRQADYSRWTTPPCVKAGIKSKLTASILLLLHLLLLLLRLLTPSASPPAVHWFGAGASIPPRAVGALHAWPCAVVLRLKCWGTETFFPERGASLGVVKALLPPGRTNSCQGAGAPLSGQIRNYR